jgi:hypothetical protein
MKNPRRVWKEQRGVDCDSREGDMTPKVKIQGIALNGLKQKGVKAQ